MKDVFLNAMFHVYFVLSSILYAVVAYNLLVSGVDNDIVGFKVLSIVMSVLLWFAGRSDKLKNI